MSLYFLIVFTARDGQDPVCQETFPESVETAASTGYARSKWVVEKICQRVGKSHHRRSNRIGILRIGQIVGDTMGGVWNETEAWPVMFKSIETLGALPETDEVNLLLVLGSSDVSIASFLASRQHCSSRNCRNLGDLL